MLTAYVAVVRAHVLFLQLPWSRRHRRGAGGRRTPYSLAAFTLLAYTGLGQFTPGLHGGWVVLDCEQQVLRTSMYTVLSLRFAPNPRPRACQPRQLQHARVHGQRLFRAVLLGAYCHRGRGPSLVL